MAHANDDHRLLFDLGVHVINVSLYAKIPYDVIKDFSPISLIAVARPRRSRLRGARVVRLTGTGEFAGQVGAET